MNKQRPLFCEPWFSRSVFTGLNSALHGQMKDTLAKEGSFMSEMVLWLLDSQKSGELFNKGLYDFYSFCQPRLGMTYSQIYQDLWVLYMTKEQTEGFFVEFGACDGLSMSNTLLLEREYGWKGILAEPNPFWHSSLDKNRSCIKDLRCVAARSGDHEVFLHVPQMPELSRLSTIIPNDIHENNGNRSGVDEVVVETISLMDLLVSHDAPHHIEYLSIDTEGSEYEILENFDFSAYSFELISIEHAGEVEKREKLRNLLQRNSYKRWRPELSRWDDWYIRDK